MENLMKRFLIPFLLLISSPSLAAQNFYDYRIRRVVDGDTVEIVVPHLPMELGNFLKLRIYGVDTPEKGFRAHCSLEDNKGNIATKFTQNVISKAKSKQVRILKWDKYGGRVLGDVVLDGKSLRMMLIQSGNAVEYYGAKKKSWCNEN